MDTIRFALRSLRQSPGFTFIAVLALALGIGANSAIFSLVNAIFLKPLPYADAERIVQLTSSVPEQQLDGAGFSWPRLQAVQDRQQSFDRIAASIGSAFTVTGDSDPEQVQGMRVSQNFFALLGVQPALGRSFLPAEDQAGGAPVVIISHGFWERRFGAQPDVLGQSVMLDGRAHTVIGVMPAALSGFPMNQIALWTTRPQDAPFLARQQVDSGGYFFSVWGRLRQGVSLEQARGELAVIAAAYAQANPANVDAKSSANANRLLDDLVGNQTQTYSLLLAAVGCVLLIACANVANLVLARYAARRKPVAVRYALGARRYQVVAQFLTENVLLALAGGLMGLLLAAGCLSLLVAAGDAFIPRAADVTLDSTVVGFTLLVALTTGLLLGMLPVLQSGRPALAEALKDNSRNSTGGRRQNRIRSALMVAEIAVSFVLLIAASLLISSFVRLQQVEPGFNPDGVFVGQVQLPPTQYPDRSAALVNAYSRLLDQLAAIPGVQSVALNDTPPLSGFGGPAPYTAVGQDTPMAQQPLALRHLVSPDAFTLLGVPLLEGRAFTARDTPDSPPVVIINAAMARQLFPGGPAVGRRIRSGMLQLTQEIVGVVADTHTANLTSAPVPEMYYPVLQRPEGFTTVMVRSSVDAVALATGVRAALKAVDPGIPLTNPGTLRHLVDQSMADRQLTMWLLAGFAGLALVLASIGVYSVMAYSVGQRSGEIGVRLALGAAVTDVRRLIVRQGMQLAAIGVALGGVGAIVLTRLMSGLLFGIGASDPLTYAGIGALLALVALLACWIPARRAAQVPLLTVLRGH